MNNQIIPTFTNLHNIYSKRKDNLSNHNYNYDGNSINVLGYIRLE